MKIRLRNGLPIVSLHVSHRGQTITLPNVLFDTGCAATVFDTDQLATLGIHIDFIHGKAKRMYGVGGTSETCYEQTIPGLRIEHLDCDTFPIQLGAILEPYGFDGILGIDFMTRTRVTADFHDMSITFG